MNKNHKISTDNISLIMVGHGYLMLHGSPGKKAFLVTICTIENP